MKHRSLIFSLSLGALLVTACAPAQFFAQRSNEIHAGIGLLSSDLVAGVKANHTPFVFYNLENNRRVKPAQFTFTNPVHQTMFTQSVFDRWTLLGGAPPPVNSSVLKQHAPYWEVDVATTTDEQLSQLDMLLLSVHGVVSLTPLERSKILRFVEKGGVLWIDANSTTNLDPVNTLPSPFITTNSSLGASPGIDFTQSLVNRPNAISGTDLLVMQNDISASFLYLNLASQGLGAYEPILAPLESESLRLQPVAIDTRGPFLMVGQLGDGYVVITTRGVATTMNRVYFGGGYVTNNAATALPFNYDRGADAAARLAVNMVYLAAGHNQTRNGSRRGGSSPIDLGAPQIQRFMDPAAANGQATGTYRPPAVGKGAMVYSTNDHVIVYDANPGSDLDGDGNPDDGVADYNTGTSYDVIWESQALAGPISAPVIIDVPNASSSTMITQVVVTDANGTLHGFPLFTYTPQGNFLGSTSLAPTYSVSPSSGVASFSGSDDSGPYPPAFHEGFLFINDAQDTGLGRAGRIWIANPATGRQVTTGANPWNLGGATVRIMGEPSTPPTVGYIPIADNSGGVDKVIYVAGRPNPSGIDANSNASITSLWFGVKGEKPTSWQQTTTYLELSTRASNQGLSILRPSGGNDEEALGVRLTVIHGATGLPYTPAEMTAVFDGSYTETNGILRFNFVSGQQIGANDEVRVDYTIDYGTGVAGTAQQVVRGNLILPDDSGRARRILNSMALTPSGIMHVVSSSASPSVKAGGLYMAIQEEGRGNFVVKNRFDLYPSHTITLNQAGATEVTYPATFADNDPLMGLLGFGSNMSNLTFVGGPTLRNGVCYVTARGNVGFVPCGIILAFRAEPEPLLIRTGALSDGFTIMQPDMSRSSLTPGGRPDAYSVLQAGQYSYSRVSGEDSGTIRIDNLSTNTRGVVSNALSTGQPIIIRQNGQNDILLEPEATSSRWNQLLWYAVTTGLDLASPAYVTGNTLFVAGASSWPSILAGTGFTPAGEVMAMSTDISPNDTFLVGDATRPWLQQATLLKVNPNFAVNPAFLWPGTKGITSWTDYQIRLEQSVMRFPGGTPSAFAQGVVGGEGTLVSWSSDGLWSYNKGDILVADEGRIAKFDPQGSPIWSMDATFKGGLQGDAGASQQTNRIVRPTRAYQVNDQEVLIVDTGANRIVQTDISGRESRSIANFTLDPSFRPSGYETNETTALKAPRDAIYFTTITAAASNPLSNPAAFELWRHYLVADSGNKRLVELVDRYQYDPNTRQTGNVILDSNGARAVGVLYWHSPAEATGGRFEYTSLARVYSNGTWVYAAGVGNKLATESSVGLVDAPTNPTRPSEDGNGAIVLFDGANTKIINEVNMPALGANTYWDATSGSYNSPAYPATTKRLGGLKSVTMRNIQVGAGSEIAIMFTDNSGVYECISNGTGWDVDWFVDRSTYQTIRRNGAVPIPEDNPLDFQPTFARRLESGDVMICNGYVGHYGRSNAANPRVAFSGEVMLLDGSFDLGTTNPLGFNVNKQNFGFRTMSILTLLNNKPGANLDTRGIVLPVYADRQ